MKAKPKERIHATKLEIAELKQVRNKAKKES